MVWCHLFPLCLHLLFAFAPGVSCSVQHAFFGMQRLGCRGKCSLPAIIPWRLDSSVHLPARGHPTSTTSSVLQPHFCDVGLTWPHSIGALLHPSFYLICSPSADPQGGALVLLSSSAPCGPTLLPIAAECPLMSLLAGKGGVPVAPSPLHTAPLPSPEHGVWSPADRHGLAAVPHPRPSPGWVDRHKDVSAIPDIAHPVSR